MRYVIVFSFAALALWVLWATGAIMAVLVFLMVGAVPGTQLSVPPSAMFGILGLAMIAMFYWLSRLNIPAQVKDLREAYHSEVSSQTAPQKTTNKRAKTKKQPHPMKTFIVAIVFRLVVLSRPLRYALRAIGLFFGRAARGIVLIARIVGHVLFITTKAIIHWADPFVRKAAIWSKKQISYSVKGTMLSAHKWSSLSKKAFASGALALKRCNSLLKRVKSLLIRSAR